MSAMMCTWCLVKREYPRDFPQPIYAICDRCFPEWTGQSKVWGARPWMGRLCGIGRWIKSCLRQSAGTGGGA